MQRGATERLPFFCVHGAGGNVLNFRDLACALDARQPFHALQASGVDGVNRPHGSIEEMAAAYVAELTSISPHGPYLVGGYSGGGIVAYEMAQRLRAAGQSIALLALFDTMHPRARPESITWAHRIARLRREGAAYVVEGLHRRAANTERARALRLISGHLARGETIPMALREAHLIENFRRAVAAYRPQKWSGRVVLFRSHEMPSSFEKTGPTYGWDRDALGGVEIVTVDGDHHSLLVGANVRPLARELDAVIARATATRAA
jgi:thioesterase domain-containing protein